MRPNGMKKQTRILTVIVASVALLVLSSLAAPAIASRNSFGFESPSVSGFPTGQVSITGGGAYDLPSFVKAGGSFKCKADIDQGPLKGCKAGEGVRWDTVALLPSTTFKCTGASGEAFKTATTDDDTVVIQADFYRQGDGNEESFTAKMFVSEVDEASDIDGDQKAWIQGVGCGDAIANFN